MTSAIRSKALRLLAAGGLVAAVMLPAAAFAQDVSTYGNGSNNASAAGSEQGSTVTVEATQTTSGSLPFTGGDVVGLVIIGGAAVAGGTVLVRTSRRRHADA